MRFPSVSAAVVLLASALLACNSGRNQLLADLQSTRPEQRALAVHRLAEQNRPEDLVLFTRAAKDISFLVREEAATALGRSQDPRVVDLLGELLEDPEDGVQQKAAIALAGIKSDKSKGYLTLQYGRQGRSTRIEIVQALKSAKVPNAMATVVTAEAHSIWDRNLRALSEGTLPERVGAAEELGKSGRPEAVTRLMPMLKDSQVILAAAAVRGLGYAGDPKAAEPMAALLNETFPDLRESVIQSLLRLGDAHAVEALQSVALEKSAASARATDALAAMPRSPKLDEVLCSLVVSGDEAVALPAGRALRKRGGCPLESLEKKFPPRPGHPVHHPEHVGVDTEAAGLLAIRALGPSAKEALPLVMPFLTGNGTGGSGGSGDAKLRRLAVRAAAEIADPSAGDAVEKALTLEQDAIKPLRADWVSAPMPKQYAPGFDPNATAIVGSDEVSNRKAKQAELMTRIKQVDAAKRAANGKTALQALPPNELVDDVSEEQLKPLADMLFAAGKLHTAHALDLLKPYAQDGSSVLRAAALSGLAALGPSGWPLARQGLVDADHEVQVAVAEGFVLQGKPGAEQLITAIATLSGDRGRLLEVLDTAELPDNASSLLKDLVQQGGAEAAMAARMLGSLKAHDAVDVLLKVLDDPTAVARRDALTALGKIGEARAAEAIGRDLYNDSPDVRTAAAQALGALGVRTQDEALAALQNDYYLQVRDAAHAALTPTKK